MLHLPPVTSRPARSSTWPPELRKTKAVYEVDNRVYAAACKDLVGPQRRGDLWAIFAGEAAFTREALAQNLSVFQPLDSLFGTVLTARSVVEIKRVLLRGAGIWLAVIAFPCTLWSILNWNCNYVSNREQLLRLQEAEEWTVDLAVEVAWVQLKLFNFFIIENPLNSRAWKLDSLCELRRDPRVYTVTGHACAHDLKSVRN